MSLVAHYFYLDNATIMGFRYKKILNVLNDNFGIDEKRTRLLHHIVLKFYWNPNKK